MRLSREAAPSGADLCRGAARASAVDLGHSHPRATGRLRTRGQGLRTCRLPVSPHQTRHLVHRNPAHRRRHRAAKIGQPVGNRGHSPRWAVPRSERRSCAGDVALRSVTREAIRLGGYDSRSAPGRANRRFRDLAHGAPPRPVAERGLAERARRVAADHRSGCHQSAVRLPRPNTDVDPRGALADPAHGGRRHACRPQGQACGGWVRRHPQAGPR